MKKILLPFFILLVIGAHAQSPNYLLVGTYTSGKSQGIYVYKFNTDNADNSLISVAQSSNPSFLAVSPNQKYVYAVNENADTLGTYVGGSVSAFSFDKLTGKLTPLNQQLSMGKHPCYVTTTQSGQWVFVGNYTSGNLSLFKTNKEGLLDSATTTLYHKGFGPNTQRQDAPHVHSTILSKTEKYLYVPDLGIDKIMIYTFDKNQGKLTLKSSAASLPGSGPRHFVLDAKNKFAYLMEELTGTVVAYKVKNFNLKNIQRISALPTNFKGAIGSADIHISVDGKFLYCSNRGDANSISIFKINKKTGRLATIGYQSTFGSTPRNFNFSPSGNFLLVANQNSDEIIIFKVDKQTGLLTDTGKKISVPNPVCLQWIK